MSANTTSNEKNPLSAAQAIVTALSDMKPEQQSLALKFAVETLGLKLPSMTSAPAAQVQSRQPHADTAMPPLGSTEHSTDIRSFTEMKSPQSDQQFSAVVAYFYQFEAKPEERRETINQETMKEAARLAGRAQVSRWNMTLTNAKNAGYLDAVGDGNFRLSSVGENLVAITLPGNSGAVRTKRIKNAKKTAKTKMVDKKTTKKK